MSDTAPISSDPTFPTPALPAPTSGTRSIATVPTDKASRYLQQLAKHFAHKIPVSFSPEAGDISFAFGHCHMDAEEDRLVLTLIAPNDADMPRLQDVVASHLIRFAFREEIPVEWQAA